MFITELGEKTIKDLDSLSKRDFLDSFKDSRQKTLRELGFLEFRKHRKSLDSSEEKINDKKDLEKFIAFLDKKYKEWESSHEKI
jgi:hypothetical protein